MENRSFADDVSANASPRLPCSVLETDGRALLCFVPERPDAVFSEAASAVLARDGSGAVELRTASGTRARFGLRGEAASRLLLAEAAVAETAPDGRVLRLYGVATEPGL